jgi:hypothetical protein
VAVESELNEKAYRLSELENESLLILLGEAGIGKSQALKTEYEIGKRNSVPSVFIDLGKVTSSEDIFAPIFDQAQALSTSQNTNNALHVYCDAFDEIALEKTSVLGWLAKAINELPSDLREGNRVRLLISTRPVAWEAAHTDTLKSALRIDAKDEVQFVLQPLIEHDVETALGQDKYEKVPSNLKELLRRPIFLALYIEAASEDESDTSVAGLYEQFVRHRIYKTVSLYDEVELYFLILGRLSLLSLMAHKSLISLNALPQSLEENQFHWSEIVGSKITTREKATGQERSWEVDEELAWKALKVAPLIKKTGEWEHKSYPEFMAGYYLANLPNARHLTEEYLGSPTGTDDQWRPAESTIEILKWASCFNKAVRSKLIQSAPDTLARHDLAMWDDESKHHLVDSLLLALSDEKFYDWGLVELSTVSQLHHPTIVYQLRTAIQDLDLGVMARRFSINLAEEFGLNDLTEDIWNIAKNEKEPSHLRREAISAVNKLSEEYSKQFKELLVSLNSREESGEELRGKLLNILWPKFLSFGELLGFLKPVQKQSYIGFYHHFLCELKVENLNAREALQAIEWLSTDDLSDDYSFKRAKANICAAIIPRLDNEKVREAIAENIESISEIGYYASRDERLPIDDASKSLSWDIRRDLIKKIRTVREGAVEMYWYSFSLFDLVRKSDFEQIRRELLTTKLDDEDMLLDILFRYISGRSFDEIEEVWKLLNDLKTSKLSRRYKKLDERLQNYFSWEIKSGHSKHEKERWQREQKKTAKPDLSLQEVLANTEDRLEGQLPQQWWQLDYALILREKVSKHDGARNHYQNDLEADLASCQAWKELSDDKQRIYQQHMLDYINLEPLSDDWDKGDGLHRPAAAGLRALIYFCVQEPQFLKNITESAWRHWAAPAFRIRLTSNNQNFQTTKLFAELFARVPDCCIKAIKAWRDTGAPVNFPSEIISFFADTADVSDELLSALWEAANSLKTNIGDARQIVRFLAGRHYPVLVEEAFNTISSIDADTEVDTEQDQHFPNLKVTIAAEVLRLNLKNSWKLLREKHALHPQPAEWYLMAVADRNRWGEVSIIKPLKEEDLYFLYKIYLAANYERQDGFVSAYDQLMEVCSAAGSELKSRGTETAVQYFEKLFSEFPDTHLVKSWLEDARRKYADSKLNVIDLEKLKKALGSKSTRANYKSLIEAQNPAPKQSEKKVEAPEAIPDPDAPIQEPTANKTINILLVASEWSSSKGGLSTLNRQLAIALAEEGHRVTCLVPKAESADKSSARAQKVTLIDAGAEEPGTAPFHALDNLYHWQPSDGDHYDLVIGHDLITGRHAYQIKKKLNARLAIVYHTIPDEIELYKHENFKHGSEKGDQKSKIQKSLCQHACVNIAVGPRILDHVRNYSPDALYLVPPINRDFMTVKGKVGDAKSPTWFYFVGRMEDASLKGWGLLLAACVQGQEQGIIGNFKLRLRGFDDFSYAELDKDRSKLPVSSKIKSYAIDLGDLIDDFNSIDCLVMPSRAEGYGLVTVDAISATRVFLISDQSGVFQEIQALVEGTDLEEKLPQYTLNISNDDDLLREEIIGKLKHVCDNREEAHQFASELHKLAKANWTYHQMIEGLQRWINDGLPCKCNSERN